MWKPIEDAPRAVWMMVTNQTYNTNSFNYLAIKIDDILYVREHTKDGPILKSNNKTVTHYALFPERNFNK